MVPHFIPLINIYKETLQKNYNFNLVLPLLVLVELFLLLPYLDDFISILRFLTDVTGKFFMKTLCKFLYLDDEKTTDIVVNVIYCKFLFLSNR